MILLPLFSAGLLLSKLDFQEFLVGSYKSERLIKEEVVTEDLTLTEEELKEIEQEEEAIAILGSRKKKSSVQQPQGDDPNNRTLTIDDIVNL